MTYVRFCCCCVSVCGYSRFFTLVYSTSLLHTHTHTYTHTHTTRQYFDICKRSGQHYTTITITYQRPDTSAPTQQLNTTRPQHQNLKMPIFRTLTTKLKTSLSASSSPESSPEQSPTSPQVSSFERISGRKEGNAASATASKRPEVQDRVDSFMTQGSNASNESVEEKKQKRLSRFREELDFEAED